MYMVLMVGDGFHWYTFSSNQVSWIHYICTAFLYVNHTLNKTLFFNEENKLHLLKEIECYQHILTDSSLFLFNPSWKACI